MTLRIPRRTFVAAAFGTASLPLWPAASLGQASGQVAAIHNPLQSFDLEDVRLGAGPALEAAQVNRRYLMELDPDRFVRVHRSSIVQIDRVKELIPDFHGDFTLVLKSGTRLTLSRTYRAKVETLLGREL